MHCLLTVLGMPFLLPCSFAQNLLSLSLPHCRLFGTMFDTAISVLHLLCQFVACGALCEDSGLHFLYLHVCTYHRAARKYCHQHTECANHSQDYRRAKRHEKAARDEEAIAVIWCGSYPKAEPEEKEHWK